MKRRILSATVHMWVIVIILTASLPQAANGQSYIDFGEVRIMGIYINSDGLMLIRISAAHGSPEGYLVIEGGTGSETARIMYATACLAQATQKNCWVRVVPVTTGYWPVNILFVLP